MMRAALALGLVACSFQHGTSSDGGGAARDAPLLRDARVVDARPIDARPIDAPRDAAMGASCLFPGERVCPDPGHAAACDLTFQPVIDRTCPPGSSCSQGHCRAPAGATACKQQGDCSGVQVCDLYVVLGFLVGACTDPMGATGPYTPCSPIGDDTACQSGICTESSGGTAQCLVPCQVGSDAECPGHACDSIASPATIEGVSTFGKWGCD
ncbi:MAG TPA: hypothetical protein VLX92_06590 [Kofleriaceae bacterium]|nr:hypothetical protein [Kofleriaceae bacterium]